MERSGVVQAIDKDVETSFDGVVFSDRADWGSFGEMLVEF